GTTAHPKAFALADGMKPNASVRREFLSGFQVDDVAGFLAEMKADELGVFYFSEKTDSLAVGAIFRGKVEFAGVLAQLRLGEMANGKKDAAQLLLAQAREK